MILGIRACAIAVAPDRMYSRIPAEGKRGFDRSSCHLDSQLNPCSGISAIEQEPDHHRRPDSEPWSGTLEVSPLRYFVIDGYRGSFPVSRGTMNMIREGNIRRESHAIWGVGPSGPAFPRLPRKGTIPASGGIPFANDES